MLNVEPKEVTFRFGDFELDPVERVLLADGKPVRLAAKEFETLHLLVRNHGHVLSKEEMMATLWPDSFVEEGNLAKQISRLRKVLDRNGMSHIETVPKHGYRFTADVEERHSSARPLTVSDELPQNGTATFGRDHNATKVPEPQKARSYVGLRVASAVGVLVLAGIGLWYYLSAGATSPERIQSVAVLPFRSVGVYDGADMLRHGLTDALTTKLSTLDQLVVRPTNAVRDLDGQDAVESGRRLRVDAILDGSVQRMDTRVRVTVQLIRSGDGKLLWSGTFDENSADLFGVQDAIAEQVARSIEPGLTGDDRRQLTKRYTTNPDAHYAYVRGRYFWNKRTVKDLRTALEFFKEAVSRDPNYALAYAGLADTYSLMADYRAAPTLESYEKAKAAATKSLELDPDLAEGHTALAYVSMYGLWDFKAAERGYSRAVELNPNYATAHQWFSEFLASQGRIDEALVEIRRAKEIDPLSPVINAGEVWVLYYGRRYDEAIDLGRKLAERNPDFAEVHEYLKRCYDQKGMYREAITARQMRRKLVGLEHSESPQLRTASTTSDRNVYWRARLEQEFLEMHTEDPSTFDMAEIYAQLGDHDKAFEWLERSAADRTYTMLYLRVAPNLDPIRSDPRFTELLRRVKL